MKKSRIYRIWNDGLSIAIDVTDLAKVEVILSERVVKMLFKGNNKPHAMTFETTELAKTIGDGLTKMWVEYWDENE